MSSLYIIRQEDTVDSIFESCSIEQSDRSNILDFNRLTPTLVNGASGQPIIIPEKGNQIAALDYELKRYIEGLTAAQKKNVADVITTVDPYYVHATNEFLETFNRDLEQYNLIKNTSGIISAGSSTYLNTYLARIAKLDQILVKLNSVPAAQQGVLRMEAKVLHAALQNDFSGYMKTMAYGYKGKGKSAAESITKALKMNKRTAGGIQFQSATEIARMKNISNISRYGGHLTTLAGAGISVHKVYGDYDAGKNWSKSMGQESSKFLGGLAGGKAGAAAAATLLLFIPGVNIGVAIVLAATAVGASAMVGSMAAETTFNTAYHHAYEM